MWVSFALPPLLALTLLGRGVALPPEFAPLAARLPAIGGSGFLVGLVGGSIGGLLVVAVVVRVLRRDGPPPTIGDTAPLLPRNRAEAAHTALLSASAGVTEELAFRLTLPLLLVLLGVSPLVAFAGTTALFAGMHLYQGWTGVVATGVLGAGLAFIYLASGSLWLAMLVHVAVDLNGLVLRPWLTGGWSLRPSAASPSGRST